MDPAAPFFSAILLCPAAVDEALALAPAAVDARNTVPVNVSPLTVVTTVAPMDRLCEFAAADAGDGDGDEESVVEADALAPVQLASMAPAQLTPHPSTSPVNVV